MIKGYFDILIIMNVYNIFYREFIKLKPKTGIESGFEIRGTGAVSTKWFEAKKNSSGEFEYTERGKREMDMAASEAVGNSGSSSSSAC